MSLEKIESMIRDIEIRTGKLVSALTTDDKKWVTFDNGTTIYLRVEAIKALLSGVRIVVEANLPIQKHNREKEGWQADFLETVLPGRNRPDGN